MCEISLKAISLACRGKYIKGMKAFAYVESLQRVDAIPTPDGKSLKVTSNITFKPAIPEDLTATPPVEAVAAGQLYKWMTSKVEGAFTVELQGDEDTRSFKTTYETFIPGLTEEVAATLNETIGHELICIACDKSGNNRILGEIGNGCTLSYTEQVADKPGFKLKFEWESSQPPLFYTGSLPA